MKTIAEDPRRFTRRRSVRVGPWSVSVHDYSGDCTRALRRIWICRASGLHEWTVVDQELDLFFAWLHELAAGRISGPPFPELVKGRDPGNRWSLAAHKHYFATWRRR